MSRNIYQVYTDNPITSNVSTDLIYIGQSPYGATDDAAINFQNFAAQFSPASSGFTWIDASVNQTMAPQTGYKVNGAGLISLALPTTIAENTLIEVGGYSSSGWIITQSAGQQILFSAVATTLGATGSVASSNRYDCIRLLVAVANTTFLVLSSVGNLTVV